MATKVTMPKLSDTMVEGTLIRWLKKEGESVDAAEVIAEAESDKATMELEAFDAGVLKKILVPEGGKVPVGGLLALIGEEDEDIGALLKEIEKEQAASEPAPGKVAAAAAEKQPAARAAAGPETEPSPEKEPSAAEAGPMPHAAPVEDKAAPGELLTTGGMRIKASPLARKLARERGLNLRRIAGTGSGGHHQARYRKSSARWRTGSGCRCTCSARRPRDTAQLHARIHRQPHDPEQEHGAPFLPDR